MSYFGGKFISFATFCISVASWSNSASVLPDHSVDRSDSFTGSLVLS